MSSGMHSPKHHEKSLCYRRLFQLENPGNRFLLTTTWDLQDHHMLKKAQLTNRWRPTTLAWM